MPAPPRKRRVRAPDVTREKLLNAAFEEMYLRGFQAASLDTILARAGVTKGALYHHFPDKAALGYAVVDEVIRQPVLEAYLGRLRQSSGSDQRRMTIRRFQHAGVQQRTPERIELIR